MNDLNKPVLAGHLLDALYHSIREGKKISNIPGLIEQLVAEDIWKEVYVEETERTVTYDRFENFLTTPPPEGLGIKTDDLKQMIGDDLVTLNLLDDALQGKPGSPLPRNEKGQYDPTVYNIHNRRPAGTSRQAGLRRLRLHRPDLLQRVLDKELSVNAAMVEAGFRTKRIVVPAKVEAIVQSLKDNFNDDEIAQIVEGLKS